MTIRQQLDRRKPQHHSPIAGMDDGAGLTADEFNIAARRLLDHHLHPIAIGHKSNAKPAGKAPWHCGVTGRAGLDAAPEDVAEWPADVARRIYAGARGVLNLGMRMPVGGLGIDVDAYDGKRGLDTIAEHEDRLGPLPPSYRITARPYEEGSGIRLYRVPDDWTGKTILKTDDGAIGHIELIQRHHRLAAVPPSHHHTGARYRLYDERTGAEVPDGLVPPLEDWPKLPDAWLDSLRADSTKAGGGEATDEAAEQFTAEHIRNEQPWHLAEYVVPPVRNATSDTRNAAFDALHEAARMARVGWYPWASAMAEIEAAARDSYAQRGTAFDASDFARSARYAVGAANAEDMADLEARAERRMAGEQRRRRQWRAMAPGGPLHPDTLWPDNQTDKVGAAPAAADDDRPSWSPVDIGSVRRSVGATPPTILKRTDGACLFYRGKVHSVHGESESGKSWLVQCATAECLLSGEPVLYIDFEDEAEAVAERLIRLGVPSEIVDNSELFVYVRPETPPTTYQERAAFDALLSTVYTLAVVDGVTDAMGLFGLSGMDADDVAKWQRLLPKAIARNTGAAVVCVDHVAKDSHTRGRFALGSQHKIAGLSGAAYVVEMEQPFAVGQAGRASVRVGKDRPGRVRGLGGRWRKSDRTQHIADLILDSADTERTVWMLELPEHAGNRPDVDGVANTGQAQKIKRPTWFMERISRYWEKADDPAARTSNKTVAAMCEQRKEQGKSQNRQSWRDAIKFLVDEGFAKIEKGARASEIHVVAKPYRQHEDPLSDEYSKAARGRVEGWKQRFDPAVDNADSGADVDELQAKL